MSYECKQMTIIWVILLICVSIIIIGSYVLSHTSQPEIPSLSGSAKIIIGEVGEVTWYENIIRYLLPNAEFIRTSRLAARDNDIVVFSWRTMWDKIPLGDKGYRIFIDAEPFPLNSQIKADLIISTKHTTDISSIYLPYYAMTFLERKDYHVTDLLSPPSNINRDRFCIFVHSNCNPDFTGVRYREKFFDVLESTSGEKIDSPGKCKNNISFNKLLDSLNSKNSLRNKSTQLDYSRWTSNVDLFRSYKFVFAIENDFSDGYITEKLINPLLAGAIPIYYGPPDINTHFNPRRFINIRDFPDMESCAQYIVKVNNDPKLYLEIQSEPIFLNNDISTNTYLSWIYSGIMYPELIQALSYSKISRYLPYLDNLHELDHIPSHELGTSETIHYLNMDRSLDRNQNIIILSDRNNTPIKRIPAYDGKLFTDIVSSDSSNFTFYIGNVLIRSRTDSERGQLFPGEFGCSISHISLWLSLLRSNLPYLCVIEDDMKFTEVFVDKMIATAPLDWDLLYIGYSTELCQGIQNQPNYNSWVRAYRAIQPCTYGYIINRRCALFLLKNCWPISLPVDEFIRKHFDNINAYIPITSFVTVDPSFKSTIQRD